MKQLSLSLALTLALAACGPTAQQAPAPEAASDQPAEAVPPKAADALAEDALANVLAGSWRSAGDKARDEYRHPKATLEFFGVKPGQTLVEITPGGGWYTEILAPLLKGNGTYIAAYPADSTSDYAKRNNEKFRAMLVSDPEHLGEAKTVEYDVNAPKLGPDGSADVVLTFRNVHNWGDKAPLMFQAFNAVLKPGGTLGVVDHRAADNATPESLKKSGYMLTDAVVKLATDAGFKLVEQSEINANPKDTKDYERGVWTLPPTLTLGDVDRDKYLAIGESDRMTLKFVKPKGDQIFEQGTDKATPEPAGN
ncbi:MAG: methyltransferase domain-containing protein [Dokdonella sp.]|nr:class I SAM-dependent methyltransferase [Dokdonella sp.]MCB1569517.1 class I SAM-dependent methyltransferase [Xanthomonadales bacterium]MCB1572436.1 class I SAM-dependent methyltransferase [Xanthomonadales bacterium]MCB1576560.1 class I SAM-dependent methyltransferase [Xanthomonadales bacterium]